MAIGERFGMGQEGQGKEGQQAHRKGWEPRGQCKPHPGGKTSGSGGRLGSPSSLLCESCLLSGLSVHGCNMGTQESLT